MSNYWQGKLIRLRAITAADAVHFERWNNEDSDRARHLDFLWPPTSPAEVEAWAEAQSRKKLENDVYRWVIETLVGEEVVGEIDTHHCNPRVGTFSYGVDVAEQYRRRGYAREAILMVLRYYFDELRYQKVTVTIHANNPTSVKLHEALGFLREGCLRRVVYSGGEFFDEYYYGLTAEEFHAAFGR